MIDFDESIVFDRDGLFESTWQQVLSAVAHHDVALVGASRATLCDFQDLAHVIVGNFYSPQSHMSIGWKENAERTKWLKELLLDKPYDLMPIYDGDLQIIDRVVKGKEKRCLDHVLEVRFLVVNTNDRPDFKKDVFVVAELFNQDSFLFKAKGEMSVLVGTNASDRPGYGVEVTVDDFIKLLERQVKSTIVNAQYAYHGEVLGKLDKEQKLRKMNFINLEEKYATDPNLRGSWGVMRKTDEVCLWSVLTEWNDSFVSAIKQQVYQLIGLWESIQKEGCLTFEHGDLGIIWEGVGYLSEANKRYYQKQEDAPRVEVNDEIVQRMVETRGQKGYVVVSPCRLLLQGGNIDPCERDGRQLIQWFNERWLAGFVESLAKENIAFTPVFGVYVKDRGKVSEERLVKPAFILYSQRKNGSELGMDLLCDFAMETAEQLDQDAFVIKQPGRNAQLICFDRRFDRDLGSRFADTAEAYLDTIYRFVDKPQVVDYAALGFVYEGCFINPAPISLAEKEDREATGEVMLKK